MESGTMYRVNQVQIPLFKHSHFRQMPTYVLVETGILLRS